MFYYWDGEDFVLILCFGLVFIKLVFIDWDVFIFEIDGIKMLFSVQVLLFEDVWCKVVLIVLVGKMVLDICGGFGYFVVCCLEGGVICFFLFEKNVDVLWFCMLNLWLLDLEVVSSGGCLLLIYVDVFQVIEMLEIVFVDVILYDLLCFGIVGELYFQVFYDQFVWVICKGGCMFYYIGVFNRFISGCDVLCEVVKCLEKVGFKVEFVLDGVLVIKC